MNKRLTLGCIAAVFTAISCQKEADTTNTAPATGKLVPVTVEGTVPQTRVTLLPDGNLPTWTQGDQIGIFTADKVLCPPFTAKTGGSASTTFRQGPVPALHRPGRRFRQHGLLRAETRVFPPDDCILPL